MFTSRLFHHTPVSPSLILLALCQFTKQRNKNVHFHHNIMFQNYSLSTTCYVLMPVCLSISNLLCMSLIILCYICSASSINLNHFFFILSLFVLFTPINLKSIEFLFKFCNMVEFTHFISN